MCCRGWGSVQLYCMMAVLLPSSAWAARHSHDAAKYTTNPRVDGSLQGFGWEWFNSWKVDKNKFKLIRWVVKLPRQPKDLLYYNYSLIHLILKFKRRESVAPVATFGICDIWFMDSSVPLWCCTVDARWSAFTPPSPTTRHEDTEHTLRAKHYCFWHIKKTFNEDIYSASYRDLKLRVKMDSVP